MVWEHIKVRENSSFVGDSGDIDIAIPRNRPIASLALVVRDKNGATSNCVDDAALQTVIESLTNIKVETEERIIKEYSGQVCRDWATYRNGRLPYYEHTQVAGATYPTGWSEAVFPINFGRYPQDRQVFLAAPLYDTLDLKITYDFTVSGTAGFVTGNAKYDLYANIVSGDHEPLATSRVIEERKKTDHMTVASGIEPIGLTLDSNRQLRQILVKCYETGILEGVDVTKVALDVDSAEVVTDDWNRWQWQNAIDAKLKYEQLIEWFGTADYDNNADVVRCLIPNVKPLFQATAAGTEDTYLTTTGDQITVTGPAKTETGTLVLHSHVIPGCVFIDFDKDLSMRDVLSQGVRDIELKLTQGGAGGAVEIHEMSLAPA